MAAVSTSPRSAPSPQRPESSHRRRPIPAPLQHSAHTELFHDVGGDDDEAHKPLPGVPPISSGAVLRGSPSSPVRVNFMSENWAQPSNANVEHAILGSSRSYSSLRPAVNVAPRERELPKSPAAPTPPPHSPDYQDNRRNNAPNNGIPRPMPPLDKNLPSLGVESPTGNDAAAYRPPRTLTRGPNTPTFSGPVDHFSSPAHPTPASPGPDAVGSLVGPVAGVRLLDPHRQSRESDATSSTTHLQTSAESSATTSASSISGINEVPECTEDSSHASPESSIVEGNLEGNMPRNQSVPQFQYHHNQNPQRAPSAPLDSSYRNTSTPDLLDHPGAAINRHLTPSAGFMRRSSAPRPQSAYSVYSDFGPRGRSPGFGPGGSAIRAPSLNSRKSPEARPSSYAELLNVPYPQPAPAPINFDNSHLRGAVGNNASLLSMDKTLEMYRQNVKKTNDFSIQYSFAVFLISTAQDLGFSPDDPVQRKQSPMPSRGTDSPNSLGRQMSSYELVREARQILQRLANGGYPFAQYYLADGLASGLFSKGKEDYNSAFPLFVLAAKHGHAESAFRTALCYEFGWGCRKDPAKAVQFLRVAATKRHPGAMTRLGKACLSGDLGEKRYREGLKWLKLATECADTINNAAPYHLGCLYETGYGDDIFLDESYAAELFTQSAELGHAEANYRMGDAYEHGKLNCPRDPALSVHFYTGAAERGHPAAMMGLCAWYMVGAEPILEKDEDEAYEWSRRSAELGYVKAQYAVGYFTEMGIGCHRDILEANVWYVKAADAGDERAKQRIATINAAMRGGQAETTTRSGKAKKGEKDDKECIVM